MLVFGTMVTPAAPEGEVKAVARLLAAGGGPVLLPAPRELGQKVLRLPDHFNVEARNGLFPELRVLLGPNGLVT